MCLCASPAAGQTEDGAEIEADAVVCAAGQWSRKVAALAGVNVPLYSAEHFYIISDPSPGGRAVPQSLPVLRDPDAYIYAREWSSGLCVGEEGAAAALRSPFTPLLLMRLAMQVGLSRQPSPRSPPPTACPQTASSSASSTRVRLGGCRWACRGAFVDLPHALCTFHFLPSPPCAQTGTTSSRSWWGRSTASPASPAPAPSSSTGRRASRPTTRTSWARRPSCAASSCARA